MIFPISLSEAESFAFVLCHAILTIHCLSFTVLYFPTKIRLQKPRKYAEYGGVPDQQAINETPYFIGFFLSDAACIAPA